MLIISNAFYAQSTSGISISWNMESGCQVYAQGPRNVKDPIFIEDISTSTCIKVCEGSNVTYTLFGNTGSNNVTWNVIGGTITNQNNTACYVEWGLPGVGSLSFTITNSNGNVSKTICFEKIIKPTSLFTITPFPNINDTDDLMGCSNQTIYFSNLSTANNGTSLISYQWDFGDGSPTAYSAAFEPSHTYQQDGDYEIKLIVTNSCNCTAEFSKKIHIGKNGFEISCPSVVCEGETKTYSLPFSGQLLCHNSYSWNATGGTVTNVNPQNGDVTVNWNTTDSTGFGYLTFFPGYCNLACLEPSIIKIPVIQTKGEIIGDANLCRKSQARYKLPQWPTTDFHWEIIGNVNYNLADVILTDQRNEVIIEPKVTGDLVLKATYQNTLLHCGGTTLFTIHVTSNYRFNGPDKVCQNSTSTYTLNGGQSSNWTLTDNYNNVVTTLENSNTFTYNFPDAGNYTLSVGGDAICAGYELSITAVSLPQTPDASGELIVCPNAPYIYTVTNPDPNVTYRWVPFNGTISGSNIGNDATISFNGASPAYINLYAESVSPLVCASLPKLIPITIKTIEAELSTDFGTVCANSNNSQYQANITGTTTPYNEGETYTWSIWNQTGTQQMPSLGSISSGQGTNAVNVVWNNIQPVAGIQSITNARLRLVIQKCTLTKTIDKPIVIRPLPHLKINPVNNICSNAPQSFTLTTDNGVPIDAGSMIVWNYGTGNQPAIAAPAGLNPSFTYSNVTGSNISKTVTATITNPNGCGGTTNTASVTFEVIPSPPASLSLSSSNGNTFCTTAEINAVLTAATSVGVSNIQWFRNGVLLTGVTGTSITITPAMGVGAYTFLATNASNCSTMSNPQLILVVPCSDQPCVYSPTPILTNSSTQTCGTINLSGTASITPDSVGWNIFGPNTNLLDYPPSIFNAPEAGEYHTFYVGYYLNADGEYCKFSSLDKKIVVPYIPDFAFAPTCYGNNTFNIDFIDKTNFFTQVTSPTVTFSYKLNGASGFTTVSGTSVSGLPPGNYILKISVTGYYNGTLQDVCELIKPLTLAPVPNQNITVLTPPTCHDTSVNFGLSGTNALTDSFLWTFEPGTTNEASNTLSSPYRVFPTSGSKTVTVTITNRFGCSRTLTTTVTIPNKCFNGNVAVVSPNTATVCLGEAVTINYVPNNDSCPVTQYIWMNGTDPVLPASNTSSIQVTSPGFYWVKVKSANNCILETTNRITPIFKAPPSIKINAPSTLCFNTNVAVTAVTNATTIAWYVDGVLNTNMSNQTAPQFYGLSVGTHTITAIGTLNGCSATASQSIEIVSAPQTPVITTTITSCNPYTVVLTATSNVTEVFTWSNGMTGSEIEVHEGGPYLVKVTSGGCSATAQVDVPKNPENFIWIFPTGCIDQCWTQSTNATLIGPRVLLHHWSWLFNGTIASSGADSFPDAFTLNQTGTYNLEYTSGQCSITSGDLNYIKKECEKCLIASVTPKEIKYDGDKFCLFIVKLEIVNQAGSTIPATISVPNNEVILIPNSLAISPGVANYNFTVIPVGNFNGGLVRFILNGTNSQGEPCIFEFNLYIPVCGAQNNTKTSETNLKNIVITLAPNPAREEVTIKHNNLESNATIELFDLTGRLITNVTVQKDGDTTTINTNQYPSGIYIVVVKTNSTIISQQKLIIE